MGTILFYAKAIDFKILVAMGKFSAAQTSETTETEKSMHKLLDYGATHPNTKLGYKASRMVLKLHSDAFYLLE